MIEGRWWDRYPTILAAEKKSLEALRIEWSPDKAALDAGVMRLRLSRVPIGEEFIDLVVTYPDLYPYFRFEIDAPSLDLPYHQNPFVKNLCLIGRSTDNWRVRYTAGEFIRDQIPKVLNAARLSTPSEASELEEHQAEPFSVYYDYLPSSIIIVEDGLSVGSAKRGDLWIATRGPVSPPPSVPLRGAVIRVTDESETTIAEASAVLRGYFSDRQVIKAPWLRLDEAPRANGPELLALLRSRDTRFNALPRQCLKKGGGTICVGAVVFAEEQTWRRRTSEGWVFIYEFLHH